MDEKMVDDYIQEYEGVTVSFPYGDNLAVYWVNGAMFALATQDKSPVNLSLRCDPLLAKTLQHKYESVLPGQNLSKKRWITVVLSGQLSWEEVQDLIRHAYEQAKII